MFSRVKNILPQMHWALNIFGHLATTIRGFWVSLNYPILNFKKTVCPKNAWMQHCHLSAVHVNRNWTTWNRQLDLKSPHFLSKVGFDCPVLNTLFSHKTVLLLQFVFKIFMRFLSLSSSQFDFALLEEWQI